MSAAGDRRSYRDAAVVDEAARARLALARRAWVDGGCRGPQPQLEETV